MSISRKYDLGSGFTVKDDGYTLIIEQKESGFSSSSIGVRRPRMELNLPESIKVIYSANRKYFYLPDYADVNGMWLSVKEYPSEDACKADNPSGVFGHSGYHITGPNDRSVFRASLPFSMWKVDSGEAVVEPVGEMHKDMLSLHQSAHREQEQRANDFLAPSGWTLAKLMKKIGPWVPPAELPVVVLSLDDAKAAT